MLFHGLRPRVTRRLGWRPDLPDHRDLRLPLKVFRLPPSADLRPGFVGPDGQDPVLDQGKLGSCTANAVAGACYFLQVKEGIKAPVHASRLFVYYGERVIENCIDSDAGAELRDGMKVVATLGVPDEAEWPYDVSKFAAKPPQSAFDAAKKDLVTEYLRLEETLGGMKGCLAEGYPFVFGISVFSSFLDNEDGVVKMPGAGEQVQGGHALLMVGYDDAASRFTFRNSWGADWGMKGYGTIPYAYMSNPDLASDFWTARKDTAAA